MNQIEILLVEDNEDDAELILRALKKVNLANHFLRLKDGAEALDFIFAQGQYTNKNGINTPNVILLDIKMPKVDGIEVLRILKTNDLTRKIPIVIMTSSKEEQDVVKSYDLGVNSFVVKPIDFLSFSKAVSELGLYWVLTNQAVV